MSEHTPVSTLEESDVLDGQECLDGYFAGLANEPEPEADKSKAFWHGWRNGQMNSGRLSVDGAARNLALEAVRRSQEN